MVTLASARKTGFFINKNILVSPLMHLFKMALTFGLVFNLSFSAFPSATTGRLAFTVLAFLYGKDAFKLIVQFARQFTFGFTLFLFLIPFSMAWLAINGTEDTVMFSRALWFFLLAVLGTFLYVRMCRFSLSSAMAYYMVAMLIQSLFVFNSVFDPDFRNWVEQALVQGGNIDFSDGVRFSGLNNSGGAALAVQLGLGVAAALVLFSQSRSVWGKLSLLLAALLITIATIFVGRTGLYLSLLMLLGFIFFSGRSLFIPILLIASLLSASSYILSASSNGIELENNDIKLDRTVNWAFDVFLFGESSSADALVSELSNTRELGAAELLIGSGRVTEPDGSNYSKHDSGYVHSLYALGLPLTISFYAALFWIYWRLLRPMKGELKVIGLVFVALVFFLEVKEPFIHKYTLPFFVLVYLYLARHHGKEKAIQ